ncbi:HepT-like ribonuclease domain-containing protein [Sulfurihydrogenibium sp.]|jgi:uncharacterized protein YutE (UPF0331/DUF86 family)|uniref:DUF86 domain-containing protein n=1 Tax=Sulfurihydrogenibium sp. TaxID=2053621 RepID=UPI0026043BA8|nr:HepT-like ribonuclease domain-containing protein [Sulfurihydrogenibium sp.]
MLDIEFLNEKATKLKSALKKIKQIIDFGEDAFLKTPMYPDRVKYYLIILYDELEVIACHILSNYYNDKIKENCIEKLSKDTIFSEKLNRIFADFNEFKNKVFQENFSYLEKQLYHLTKNIVETLDALFIKELSDVVKQLKEKQPKLAIPVNLVKVNHYASAIKGEVKRLETFSKMNEQEFKNNSFAIDRSRYFIVVAIDSALWICRHISRQLKIKFSKDCFKSLAENGCLSVELAENLDKIAQVRNDLADPTKSIDLDFLYKLVKGDFKGLMDKFILEVAKSIKEGCKGEG